METTCSKGLATVFFHVWLKLKKHRALPVFIAVIRAVAFR